MHMPIRPTAPRIQTDIELKRPTTQISRNGKPKGPRRHVERIESPITPSYSSSDNASIFKHSHTRRPRSDFGLAMAARALMTQEKPVFKARTMAKALDVTHVGTGIPLNPSFSQDTLTTSMGSMEAGSLSDGFGGESTTSRSDGIPPSSASYAGRRASVRWADMNGDHEGSVTTGRSRMPSDRLSLFKITTSTSSGSASEAHTRRGSILADFLSRRESTMKMEESKDSKVPLRWREAHPEPVTPKLGPCIHNHFETQGGGFEEELVNDSFVLDNIESGPAMPKVSASHSLPIRSLVPSTFPHRYVQAEVETPITVVTVSSAETRALQRQQKQEQNASKDAITPDASLTSASQNSSLVYNRSNAFRPTRPDAPHMGVPSSSPPHTPSRCSCPPFHAGGTGLPLDPFKGSIDPRYQTTKTAIETAGVAGATGYAILICATWSWAFAGIAGVSSVILLDLRGQSCRRMGTTASAVVGLLNGCVWFLVGLFELLTTDGRDSAKK
ncbi:hypothetical protein BC829DRAFT_392148 [Chytridium lagenaria]|nr:hypothetical protein BC829DRAFT_392148 [Chytridium lagenaria]